MREGQGVKAISCLLSAMLQGQKSLRQNKDFSQWLLQVSKLGKFLHIAKYKQKMNF